MKYRSKIFFSFLFFLSVCIICEGKDFVIYQGTKEIGSESFEISSQENEVIIESSVKLELPIQKITIKQKGKVVYETKNYTFKNYESSFSAGFQVGMIKSQKEGDKIKTTVAAGGIPLNKNVDYKNITLILDNNYYSHFCLLGNLVDFSKNETISMNIFSPTVMNYFSSVLKIKKDYILKKGQEEIKLKSIMLFTPLNNFSIYLDKDNEVVCVVDNINNFKAILKEYKDYNFEEKKSTILPPENVSEEEVEFKSGEIKLSGSLTSPKKFEGRLPSFVLISGSGPQDRNENVSIPSDQLKQFDFLKWSGPDWNIFNVIAYKLSSLGYVVLRYDDRGVGKSEGSFSDAKLSDFISDVESAVSYLKMRKEVNDKRIVLLGHSEGAMIAPKVASKISDIYAIFLMAVPAESLDKIVLIQSEDRLKESGLDDTMIKMQMEKIKSDLKKIIESKDDWIEIDGQKVFTLWFKEHSKYNVTDILDEVKCPIVIFQGRKDKQVYPHYAERIEETFITKNKNNLTVRYFENLDHLFMESNGWISEYYDPDRKLSDEFLKALLEECIKLF